MTNVEKLIKDLSLLRDSGFNAKKHAIIVREKVAIYSEIASLRIEDLTSDLIEFLYEALVGNKKSYSFETFSYLLRDSLRETIGQPKVTTKKLKEDVNSLIESGFNAKEIAIINEKLNHINQEISSLYVEDLTSDLINFIYEVLIDDENYCTVEALSCMMKRSLDNRPVHSKNNDFSNKILNKTAAEDIKSSKAKVFITDFCGKLYETNVRTGAKERFDYSLPAPLKNQYNSLDDFIKSITQQYHIREWSIVSNGSPLEVVAFNYCTVDYDYWNSQLETEYETGKISRYEEQYHFKIVKVEDFNADDLIQKYNIKDYR